MEMSVKAGGGAITVEPPTSPETKAHADRRNYAVKNEREFRNLG